MRKQLGKMATISDTRWACAVRAPHETDGREAPLPREQRKHPKPAPISKRQLLADSAPLVEAFYLKQAWADSARAEAVRAKVRKLVIRY